MQILVLMENTSERAELCAEHGLSLYITAPRHTVLLDTGASDKTWQNAVRLGADLSRVDTVVVSHGHYDHAGGLLGFAAQNREALLYLRREALGKFYHGERYIGVDERIAALANVRYVSPDTYKIDDELSLLAGVSGCALGRSELTERIDGVEYADTFAHEQHLVVREGERRVLFSGCAHTGILNIVRRFYAVYGVYPSAVVSGFHTKRPAAYTDGETAAIVAMAQEMAALPIEWYTGHCTGEAALALMRPMLGDRLHTFHVGDRITL